MSIVLRLGTSWKGYYHKICSYRPLIKQMSSSLEESKCPWVKPDGSSPAKLRLYNSLTKSKDEFVPLYGRRVLWYSCGPTVYDSSHMGHARSYITFDILRRVLANYFNYEILYVMNITDIDDKIIRRARHAHLFHHYLDEGRGLTEVRADVSSAMKVFRESAEGELDPDKKAMLLNTLRVGEESLDKLLTLDDVGEMKCLLHLVKDPLSSWLDSKFGSTVTDHSIFSTLTKNFEEDYHKDMAALNVMPPDVLTRVSEYVPEVVEYVQKIVDNGYGYESNGSVYFDVQKFASSPDHHYAKLVPEAVGDILALAEGEGALSVSADKLKDKKSRNDFVLWKASKPGEPSWASPWGPGRPGWHIECSVMACDILGEKADIHTGGVDLKFPHHDNEMAQAEAHYGHNQWISYFLHSGHLTIEGCKMSKSLKNFITIKAALDRYSWRQLRLAFLLHAWGATLDYGEQTMRDAIYWERMFNEYFLKVKDLMRSHVSVPAIDTYSKFTRKDKDLNTLFYSCQSSVHGALCDSIDTPTVMKHLKDLVTACNIYMDEVTPPNVRLLEAIAQYCTKILRTFGVISSSSVGLGFPTEMAGEGVGLEAAVLPFASLVADFREEVRQISLKEKCQPLLTLCDQVRDDTLPGLGVLLEDKSGRTVVKYVGKEMALKEKERKTKELVEQQKLKEAHKQKLEEAKHAREAAAAIPPKELFRNQPDKYSQFDEVGVPTHDAQGEVLTESQRKKLRKQWQTQEKKFKEHMSKK